METLNVEIILNTHSHISKQSIISLTQHYLQNTIIQSNSVTSYFDKDLHPILHTDVKAIIIEEVSGYEGSIDLSLFHIKWHIYTLNIHGPINQIEEADEEGQLNVATHLMLPSAYLYNLWENLYYDNNIKENLLKYAKTMMEFSDRGVDSNVINCNRVILLHGPPGTGKTSLCKALAQKLSIRMQERYDSGILIEINSHSLFSKWFSESGKLVTMMFAKISEIVENPRLLVCVLIDEVESLAHARTQCISGNEPSDSVRVVNAVLTQIDRIKRHSNVLILTTSNMTESIDLAFIDRADIKQYLGLPIPTAIYKVYHSCLEELIKAQIISNESMVAPADTAFKNKEECENKHTKKLMEICERSVGLSGRSLRKVPFIAHALFLNNSFVTLGEFLDAMLKAVEREKKERKYFENIK
ncbi:pachytene checkpoint protein 2 -like [Asbolus verrucosus]|uniref:Pachytene checkpoint protein 2-like n=1 Tax=Asbolus verrucosus TaxID=1661398 RepID=A0A482VFH2_ASBVE|nr:pachytene checkpoint protein 2 -like [Asbolus verrucosus]